MSVPEVRACGGIVVRPAAGGAELVVVHRPAYDDWSLPKGKCEAGETDEDCALREVEEETALRCQLLTPVGSVEYLDRKGRSKQARFWLMTVESGELRGQDEVDEARWVTPSAALELLTYERDRALLEPLVRETALYLVRHADAGDPHAWKDEDALRPLNKRGFKQARGLAGRLGPLRPARLLSSPYVRCLQTLQPLGEALGMTVQPIRDLAEGHGLDGVGPLLLAGEAVVACTHGDVAEELIWELRRHGLAGPEARAAKGSVWHVRAVCGLPRAAEYMPPPA